MADKTTTTFGPSRRSITATISTGQWTPFGPVLANRIYSQVVCASTTYSVKLEGTLTTASTADIFTIRTHTQASKVQSVSTVAKMAAFVRIKSTSLSGASPTATVWWTALP